MKPCEVAGCGCPGQKHHIVFKSQGGLDMERNYKYLCIMHHIDGKAAVHNNVIFDHALKRDLQNQYYLLFPEGEYTIQEIAEKIGYRKKNLERRMKLAKQRAGKYEREEVVRFLMGGKLYE